MNAEDARDLMKSNRGETRLLNAWLEAINKKIYKAAIEGKSEIVNPFSGFRMILPNEDQERIIFEKLKADGFQISKEQAFKQTYFYTKISWQEN